MKQNVAKTPKGGKKKALSHSPYLYTLFHISQSQHEVTVIGRCFAECFLLYEKIRKLGNMRITALKKRLK